MMKRVLKRLFFLCLIAMPMIFGSCSTSKGFKNQAQYERKMARESRKAEKEIKKLLKAHFERQSEETKAMMKKTQKKSKEINWFRRK